jgi:hypothetical protein
MSDTRHPSILGFSDLTGIDRAIADHVIRLESYCRGTH